MTKTGIRKDPDYMKKYGKEYYRKNKAKIQAKHNNYYAQNKNHILAKQQQRREQKQEYMRKYYREHSEQLKEMCRRYRMKHPEVDRTHCAKRRSLGFIPLNLPFAGSEPHHIDKINIVYIPTEVHHSIRHNIWTGYNMDKINTEALKWLEGKT